MVRNHAGRGGRHAAPRQSILRRWLLVAGVAVAVAAVTTALIVGLHRSHRAELGARSTAATSPGAAPSTSTSSQAGACRRQLQVVSARSYAPVLRQVAAGLANGADCVGVQLTVADGKAAAGVVAASKADVWIADDASWSQLPNPARLTAGRADLATSPLYFVTTKSAPPLPASARSWLGLARQLGTATLGSWRLLLADPARSGDGMVAAAGLADATLSADGPLVSALSLMRARQNGAATTTAAALPTRPDQVAVLPEYDLLRSGHAAQYSHYAPSDGTALLRYSWLPTAAAQNDPATAAAVRRLRQALTGRAAATALSRAGLRAPGWPAAAPPGAAAAGLPPLTAPPTAVVSEHIMYHVLATFQPALRRSNMLIVTDVSGSMSDKAAGTGTPKMTLVRDGLSQVAKLLPDDASLGLWCFGYRLAPPNDWQPLVQPARLGDRQRAAIATATSRLHARDTGTGLYDTILGAYRYQQAHYVSGEPNEVLMFTDGVNEDDPASIDLAKLRSDLAASDPAKRVQLSVFGFSGAKPLPTAALSDALVPVGGQVDKLATRDQVIGAFVHAVSGALSGVPG